MLHVVGAMDRGGAETMLMAVYREIDRRVVQFDFLEFSDRESDYADEIRRLGGRVVRCEWSQRPDRLFATIRDLTRVIRQTGPYMAVHSHLNFASAWVLMAAWIAGVPVRIAHGHIAASMQRGVVARCSRSVRRAMTRLCATRRVACTRAAGRFVFGGRRFDDGGVVIRNAVDISAFHPDLMLRSGLNAAIPGSGSGAFRLLSAARMENQKNHEFLVNVAAALAARSIPFAMYFAGDGSLRGYLESAVRRRGLERDVHFLGVREDMPDLLSACDLLLMPSFYEGLPVILVEAQAAGIRCLVSEAVDPEADLGLGLLEFLPISSPEAWVEAITNASLVRPRAVEVRCALEERGYGITEAAASFLALYPQLESARK